MLPLAKQTRRVSPSFVSAALLVALLATFGWTSPARAQGAQAGSFAAAPCPLPTAPALTVDCGYLTVAESHGAFTGRTIQLAVAIVRSPNPNKAADSVLFLSGGPGQPALPLLSDVATAYADVLAQRDIVFIDQRGTGYSEPALNCVGGTTSAKYSLGLRSLGGQFPLGAAPSDRPELVQLLVDQFEACGAQYRAAGIDLSAYNSAENAADLEDLRVALGVPQWNLLGASYGTRLALTSLRDHPNTIRSAVLDSVYPLEANFHTGVFASYRQSLDKLFAACANDLACNAAYPDLGATFDELILRLNAEQIQVPLIDLQSGEIIDYLPVAGVDVSFLTFQLLYVTQAIPLLPRLIADTARGDTTILSVLLSSFLTRGAPGGVPLISQGMQIAVQCNEDATFASATDFVKARDRNRRASALAFSPIFNEAILDVCASYGLKATNPADNKAVRSNVPSLIISGELDPIMPPQNATATHKNLRNSYLVSYPRGGHTPSASSPCLASAVAAFIDNPDQAPDTSCLAAEPPEPFLTPAP